jgi:hypothetical protein
MVMLERREEGGMGRWRSAHLPLALAMLVAAAGCGRPTGDFGRARPSVVHDQLLPMFGNAAASARGEPVSTFNFTDREGELRDRAWHFVRPPHTSEWFSIFRIPAERLPATRTEWQRTRILPALDTSFDERSYYRFLSEASFASSNTRYGRVIADIEDDSELVYPFWQVACAVVADDRERVAAMARLPDVNAAEHREAMDRIAENDAVIAWVWRAVRFRLLAYRYAIDRLQIETPSDRVFETNQAWNQLGADITAAEVCVGSAGFGGTVTAVPSRVVTDFLPPEPPVWVK